MCGGADYIIPNPENHQMETRRVFFPMPFAKMPVLLDGGELQLVQWGKRKGEDSGIDVPATGWAREDNIESPSWQKHGPQNVLIPVQRFSEKGKLPKSRWFDMPPDTYIMGLLLKKSEKNFVYVVTNPAIGELAKVHDRMPLVVKANFTPADFHIAEQMEEEPDQPTQQKLF